MLLCLAACSSQREWTDCVLQENTFNGTFSELQNLALMIYKENFILSLPSQKVSCSSSHDMYKPRKTNKEMGVGKAQKGKKEKSLYVCTNFLFYSYSYCEKQFDKKLINEMHQVSRHSRC